MRKETKVVIADPASRDSQTGFTFLIREMAAWKAEKWAMRLFLALARAGVEIPPDLVQMGIVGIPIVIAQIGIAGLGTLDWKEAEPLLDEMMECVSLQPVADKPDFVRALRPDDIEEVSTFLKLRIEILNLHFDFSKAVSPSTSDDPGPAASNGSDT